MYTSVYMIAPKYSGKNDNDYMDITCQINKNLQICNDGPKAYFKTFIGNFWN